MFVAGGNLCSLFYIVAPVNPPKGPPVAAQFFNCHQRRLGPPFYTPGFPSGGPKLQGVSHPWVRTHTFDPQTGLGVAKCPFEL